MQFCKTWILLIGLLLSNGVNASVPVAADSTAEIFSSERKVLLREINVEKVRIDREYHSANQSFFSLIDSVSKFITEQDITPQKQNVYLHRLFVFLQNIDRVYSETYLKSGSYATTLRHYPTLIDWNEKGELLQNTKRFPDFSIKAVRLIPDDAIAEKFLLHYLNEYPDDIFRYTEEFDDREIALSILENALKTAPESAKRYFVTLNQVDDILSESNDLYVKKAYEIFDRFGLKSHAFLLLDAIVNKGMSLQEADAIGNDADKMFHLLMQSATVHESNLNYSGYRYIHNHCIDVMRQFTADEANAVSPGDVFQNYSASEIFTLMCYGHKECTPGSFSKILGAIKVKSSPVNPTIVRGLNREKLREFVVYCDKTETLQELLSLVNEKEQNYLMGLSTLEAKENKLPVLKSFAKVNAVVQKDPLESVNLSKAVHGFLTTSVKNALVITLKKADIVPLPASDPVEPIKITIDQKERTIISLQKNVFQSIQNISSFIKQDYAENLLSYAAQKEPDELFKKVDAFKDNRFSKKILEQCALNAPVSAKRYLYNPEHPVSYILQYSTNPAVKKIFEINPQLGNRSKPLLLLNDIILGKMSVRDAIAISTEPDKLFHALVKIISCPHYYGKYSIDREMRDYSLRFIRGINDKIAMGASQPFLSAENFSSEDLYFLMLYGRDEVFTSTFTGLFNRFLQRLPKQDGDAFLRAICFNQFRDFLSLCSNFGTMEEFLTRFSDEAKQKLLISYISNLETEKNDLTTVVLVAEAISNLHDNQLLSLLQTHIKKEYDRVKDANDQIGISIYGVLSSMISGNAQVEMAWYKRVSEQFKISPVSSLTTSALFDESKVCVQQMYFYNDEDGRSSYVNFINTYKSQSAWIIEDRKSYVKIRSKTGMNIEVLANKPEFDEAGISAIEKYLKEKTISPSVVIHRGHSFHTESTLEKIPSSAKLVFVGSCGGFYKVSMALENAPDAHIISTKQVGTKLINDAMLFALNENIRVGKDIVWNDFWDKMRLKLGANQYFSDYIPPNKNLEAMFIRAYYKLLGV